MNSCWPLQTSLNIECYKVGLFYLSTYHQKCHRPFLGKLSKRKSTIFDDFVIQSLFSKDLFFVIKMNFEARPLKPLINFMIIEKNAFCCYKSLRISTIIGAMTHAIFPTQLQVGTGDIEFLQDCLDQEQNQYTKM